jgi:hypothetical protein
MSASTLAEIMQDKASLAAACEELADFLLGRADEITKGAANGGKGFDLARALPLMCAFPSPDHMRLMAVRLRAVVRKLDAMPANAGALAGVMSGPPAVFEAFERRFFEDVPADMPSLDTTEGGREHG